MDGSGTITWRHLARLMCAGRLSFHGNRKCTYTQAHTLGDSVNQRSFTQGAKVAVFLLQWAGWGPILIPPAPPPTHTCTVTACSHTNTIPWGYACRGRCFSHDGRYWTAKVIWWNWSLLVPVSCAAPQRHKTCPAPLSHLHCALHLAWFTHWRPAPLCNMPLSLSHHQEILFNTLVHKYITTSVVQDMSEVLFPSTLVLL